MTEKFNCSKCGKCCNYVGFVYEMMKWDRGDGVCIYLNDINECDIYEQRPDICRVKPNTFKENEKACEKIKAFVA